MLRRRLGFLLSPAVSLHRSAGSPCCFPFDSRSVLSVNPIPSRTTVLYIHPYELLFLRQYPCVRLSGQKESAAFLVMTLSHVGINFSYPVFRKRKFKCMHLRAGIATPPPGSGLILPVFRTSPTARRPDNMLPDAFLQMYCQLFL